MARRPAPSRRVTTQDIDQEEEDHGEEILAHGRISRPPAPSPRASQPPAVPASASADGEPVDHGLGGP